MANSIDTDGDGIVTFMDLRKLGPMNRTFFSSGFRSSPIYTKYGLKPNQTVFKGEDNINMKIAWYEFLRDVKKDPRVIGTILDQKSIPTVEEYAKLWEQEKLEKKRKQDAAQAAQAQNTRVANEDGTENTYNINSPTSNDLTSPSQTVEEPTTEENNLSAEDIPLLLMTGMTTSMSAPKQVETFKEGYGKDRFCLSFGYDYNKGIVELKEAMAKYPDSPVVLYSAGAQHTETVAKKIKIKDNLYVLEGYNSGPKGGTANKIKRSISLGIPPQNIVTGPTMARGKSTLSQFNIQGATDTPQSPTKTNHYNALIFLGKILAQKYPPPVIEEKIEEEDVAYLPSPRFSIYTTNSNVTGEIRFYALQDGYYGEAYLTNFPEDYVQNYILGTSPISEPNYEELKKESLLQAQEFLDSLKTNEMDFGTIEEGTKPKMVCFKGTVLDKSTRKPISGATVYINSDNKEKTNTQTDGTFLLNVEVQNTEEELQQLNFVGPPVEPDVLSLEDFISNFSPPLEITVAAKNYSPSDPKSVIARDGKYKTLVGFIQLVPIEEVIKKEEMNLKSLTPIQEKEAQKGNKRDAISSILKKVFKTIQDRLIPALLKMIASFGIAKFNESVLENIDQLPKICPPDIEALNGVIEKKNKLTKQLNNLYKNINRVNKMLDIPIKTINIAGKVVTGVDIGFKILSNIPSTTFTPIPTGAVLILKDIIEKMKDLIDFMEGKLGSGGIKLKLILEELKKVLLLLSVLDALIESCARQLAESDGDGDGDSTGDGDGDGSNDGDGNNNNNSGLLNQESISNELLASTEDQALQGSRVANNVNGFTFSVATVNNSTIDGYTRRQALARNAQGVILLRGEPSFSSNDQILIDELIFYIQQNDLKAE